MAQVEVTVNGRGYVVACDEGQETHVAQLGRYLDQKVGALVKSVGQVGDARLAIMAGLMIADELVESEAANGARDPGRAAAPAPIADEAVLGAAIDRLAQRIEAVALALEQDRALEQD
jgi:cell division protein ZapA